MWVYLSLLPVRSPSNTAENQTHGIDVTTAAGRQTYMHSSQFASSAHTYLTTYSRCIFVAWSVLSKKKRTSHVFMPATTDVCSLLSCAQLVGAADACQEDTHARTRPSESTCMYSRRTRKHNPIIEAFRRICPSHCNRSGPPPLTWYEEYLNAQKNISPTDLVLAGHLYYIFS